MQRALGPTPALDPDDRVVLKPVRLGRNLGARVEIESGLAASDRLVDNPHESIATGDKVAVAKAQPVSNPVARGSDAATSAKAGPS